MTIKFEFCDKMYFSGHSQSENIEINVPAQPYTLDEAIEKAQYLIETYHLDEVCACLDSTGEVVFIARAEDDEEMDDNCLYYDEPDDWMDEVGFNPYIGGYDYDC